MLHCDNCIDPNCVTCRPSPSFYGKGDKELTDDLKQLYDIIQFSTGFDVEKYFHSLPPLSMCGPSNRCGGQLTPRDTAPSGCSEVQHRRTYNFSEALSHLKEGIAMAREGWNGIGMFLKVQHTDGSSKMTLPYIYITTVRSPGHISGNRVPWIASQTDLLSEDWYIVTPE